MVIKPKEVPEYRIIYGQLSIFNPSDGYQSFRFEDPNDAKKVSTLRPSQPIGTIEHDLRQVGPGGFTHLYFDPHHEKILMDAMKSPMQPFLRMSESQFRNILDAVRKMVLEWSLKLESDGIIGEGMSFSRQEKHKAQSITYNIKNYIHGNIEHSQVQVESVDSIQKGSFQEFDVSQLKDVIKTLKDSLDKLDIEREITAELVSEIRTLESQADSPKPKTPIIKESLASIRKILEGAAGTLVASGLLNQIGKLFGP